MNEKASLGKGVRRSFPLRSKAEFIHNIPMNDMRARASYHFSGRLRQHIQRPVEMSCIT